MTNGNFDDIRDILRQTAEQQLQMQQAQAATQQHLDQMSLAQAATQQHLDQMSLAQAATQQHLDQMSLAQAATQQHLDQMSLAQAATQQHLDRVSQTLDQMSQADAAAQQRMDRLTDRIENLAGWTDTEVQRLAEEVVSMISSLAHDLDALNSNVNAFIAQSTSFLASEQRDRAEFRQQMVGLQTETRNILRELADLRRQQQGNGKSE